MTVKCFEDLKKFEQSSRDYLFLYVYVCGLTLFTPTVKKNAKSLVSDFYIKIKNMEHSLMVSKFVSVIIIFFNAVIVCVKP